MTKNEFFNRVWPGVVVSEENLKTQVSALRKALGEDRDIVRNEFGRGYRLTAAVRRTAGSSSHRRAPSCRALVDEWSRDGLIIRACTKLFRAPVPAYILDHRTGFSPGLITGAPGRLASVWFHELSPEFTGFHLH